MQPAVAWHDDKIRTITRFQAFVKHRHVKANQKTYTQRNKTFDRHKIHFHKHISQGSSSSLWFPLKDGELCFVTRPYRANVFIRLLEKLHYFHFLHFTPRQPLTSSPEREANTSSRYSVVFFLLRALWSCNERFHTTKDQHEYSCIFHETTTTRGAQGRTHLSACTQRSRILDAKINMYTWTHTTHNTQ